jgi:hypothetical protein
MRMLVFVVQKMGSVVMLFLQIPSILSTITTLGVLLVLETQLLLGR